MECLTIELMLSEYMESSLPADMQHQVGEHLKNCQNCSAVLQEMQSAFELCQSYPTIELDPRLVERILLRTSGRPRTRSFNEIFNRYFIRPLLTPRLAVGTSLAALFLIIMIDVMMPKLTVTISSLSPVGLFQLFDRGVQQLYGEGLKIYEKKNEWQAQFNRFKNNAFNEVRFMIEQIDVPVEGRKKPDDPAPQKNNAPKEKSSSLQLLLAWGGQVEFFTERSIGIERAMSGWGMRGDQYEMLISS